jgi:superfamily II DNA/RNA helicase
LFVFLFHLLIVFIEKKYCVDILINTLKKGNYNCIGIHGDRSQDDRNFAIEQFNKGRIPLLIGTDVIGRGIDFDNVEYVINYDPPKNIDDYVHRLGRTGRCGKSGISITFLNNNDTNICRQLIPLLNKNKLRFPEFIYDIKNGYSSNNSNNYQRNNGNSRGAYGGGGSRGGFKSGGEYRSSGNGEERDFKKSYNNSYNNNNNNESNERRFGDFSKTSQFKFNFDKH